jgi:hypothetical protein
VALARGADKHLQRARASSERGTRKDELVDKPGSVVDDHSSATNVTVRLKRPTRIRRGSRPWIPIWSCSGRGLPSPRLLPTARCALTAPFHPYLRTGGFLSAALSVGSRPPGVTWRPDPLEPGLSSTTSLWQRSSDQLPSNVIPVRHITQDQ